jgi:hypothetical protein
MCRGEGAAEEEDAAESMGLGPRLSYPSNPDVYTATSVHEVISTGGETTNESRIVESKQAGEGRRGEERGAPSI